MYFARLNYWLLLAIAIFGAGCDGASKNSAQDVPDKNLKVIIIRHGEKPADGDNLSCQGQNRAMQLPAVLAAKIGKPDYAYVPSLGLDKNTAHSRMFQTITPFAVKYNLTINSKYDEKDVVKVASSVLKKNGTVLMVWEHSAIPDLANALGVNNPPKWKGADFDSMWVIDFANGKATLNTAQEGLNPSENCSF